MTEDPNATTTINLGSAMAVLASTRCGVGITEVVNQRIEACRSGTLALIALHQNGGRA